MPKVSKDSATQGGEFGPVTDRSDEIEGYSVNFTTFHVDMDQTPVLKGLPDDQCQCPHWGYVIRGRLTIRSGDREEVFEAGDAYYLAPGNVRVCEPLVDGVGEPRPRALYLRRLGTWRLPFGRVGGPRDRVRDRRRTF